MLLLFVCLFGFFLGGKEFSLDHLPEGRYLSCHVRNAREGDLNNGTARDQGRQEKKSVFFYLNV